MSNDSIYAPEILKDLLEYVWISWRNKELNDVQVKQELKELEHWLNKITKSKPKSDFWRGYF